MIDIVRKFKTARVVVIGDLIADEYVYGRVARVSRIRCSSTSAP